MRLRTLAIVISMTAGASAWAEAPAAAAKPAEPAASTAPAWDDSHMQSRYRETPRVKRPLITGESGYGALASGSAQSSEQVPEGIEFTSQRQWTQGNLSASTPSPQAASASASSQAAGPVHRSGNSGGRDSQLRRGSVHNSSRRR